METPYTPSILYPPPLPFGKKVDITICENSVTFTNPSTRASEGSVSRASIRRAFLVPTRGKSKPHWTVILLSSDTPDRGKPANPATPENPQIIFGLDATSAPPFTVTTYKSGCEPTPEVSPKGSTTLPFIRTFFTHLGMVLFEPTADVFKSACAGVGNNVMAGNIPGVEAYRAAKSGSLWFTKEGILWGESKPCEFWPVGSLISKSEGVRIIGGSGRTCSVVLTRKTESESTGGDDEDMGEETEFGMVDAREQEGIDRWVKKYRHLFGKTEGQSTDEAVDVESKQPKKVQQFGPVTINQLAAADDDDDDDDDFAVDSDSESDGGSASPSSEDDEAGGSDGSDEEEGGEDGEGSDEEGEEEELKPEHHPLLRPGAMPKMSRAAMDMVVGMVEDDMMGGGSGEEDEEDELDD